MYVGNAALAGSLAALLNSPSRFLSMARFSVFASTCLTEVNKACKSLSKMRITYLRYSNISLFQLFSLDCRLTGKQGQLKVKLGFHIMKG